MSVASALLANNDASPRLAVEALARALEKAGQGHANGVLLFLTADFAGHAQQTVTAVARAARCTQVAGGISGGVFTDSAWVLDRPAAAVMVFTGNLSLGFQEDDPHRADLLLSYAGRRFPPRWGEPDVRRFGGSFGGHPGGADAVAWQLGRLAGHCSVRLLGAEIDIGVSGGWQLLGEPALVDSSEACELRRLGGDRALDSLRRAIPDGYPTPPPLGSLCAVLIDDHNAASDWQQAFAAGAYRAIALIAANADHSLTLAEPVAAGQHLAWARRSPSAVAADMRQSINRLKVTTPAPAAAMVFSCLGRGPYYYGGEDQDRERLRECFPGLPLIGTYGTGQMAPTPAGGNRLLRNAVVTALISHTTRKADV